MHHLLAAASPTPIPPWINFSALWQIVLLGLLAGAGLPALFAIGLRALAMGTATAGDATAAATSDKLYGGNPVGLIAGGICFLIVLGAIGWGIWQIWYLGHPH
ncbi:MAG TPA: hypothetical protein VFI65_02215 [Streptosporangiaceae bacterium]|nr:hypothetical protein [Streptosporangiaceae bacterium]